MNATPQPLVRLEGITKVFHADEIETHALSKVDLEIQPGEFLSIAGPLPAAANRHFSRSWVFSIPPTEGKLLDSQ